MIWMHLLLILLLFGSSLLQGSKLFNIVEDCNTFFTNNYLTTVLTVRFLAIAVGLELRNHILSDDLCRVNKQKNQQYPFQHCDCRVSKEEG